MYVSGQLGCLVDGDHTPVVQTTNLSQTHSQTGGGVASSTRTSSVLGVECDECFHDWAGLYGCYRMAWNAKQESACQLGGPDGRLLFLATYANATAWVGWKRAT